MRKLDVSGWTGRSRDGVELEDTSSHHGRCVDSKTDRPEHGIGLISKQKRPE